MKKALLIIMMATLSDITLASIGEGYEPKSISLESKAELATSDLLIPQTREGALIWLLDNYRVVKDNPKLKIKVIHALNKIKDNHQEKGRNKKLITDLLDAI